MLSQMLQVPKIKVQSNGIINYDGDMDAYMPLIENEVYSASNVTRVFGNSGNNNGKPLMTSTPTRDNNNMSHGEEIMAESKSISHDKSKIHFSIGNSKPMKDENVSPNVISEQCVYQQNNAVKSATSLIQDDLYNFYSSLDVHQNGAVSITSELRDSIVKMSKCSSGGPDDLNQFTDNFSLSRRCSNIFESQSLPTPIGDEKVHSSKQSLLSGFGESSIDNPPCTIPEAAKNGVQENIAHRERINENNTGRSSSFGVNREDIFSVKERIKFFNRITTKDKPCTFIELLKQFNAIKLGDTLTTRKMNKPRSKTHIQFGNNVNDLNSTSFKHMEPNNTGTILNSTFVLNNSFNIFDNVPITANDFKSANNQLFKCKNFQNRSANSLCTILRQENSNNRVKPNRYFIMEDLELVKPVKSRIAEYERLIKMKNN